MIFSSFYHRPKEINNNMLSIVIIVKNDKRVFDTIDSLQTKVHHPEPIEILVVDASIVSLKRLAPSGIAKTVTWLKYRPQTTKATYAEQRNMGIKYANGDIIVFIDADCTADSSWLAKLTQPIRENEEHITTGRTLSTKKSYMRDPVPARYVRECSTMNMAISKNVFAQTGNFNEKIERVEDAEFCLRAVRSGYKILYVEDAIVFHDWGNFFTNLRRAWGNGMGRAKLYKYHPDELKPTIFFSNPKNIYSLVYTGYSALLPLAIIFPFYLLLPFGASLLLRRNPLKEIVNVTYGLGVLKEYLIPRKYPL